MNNNGNITLHIYLTDNGDVMLQRINSSQNTSRDVLLYKVDNGEFELIRGAEKNGSLTEVTTVLKETFKHNLWEDVSEFQLDLIRELAANSNP